MSRAVERGVTFFDTAEMYPVPPQAATYGVSEVWLGRWLKETGLRDKLVIATKAVGPGRDFSYVRDGNPRLDRDNLVRAVEDSLRRLDVETIDLYQLHWPDRSTTTFGRTDYVHREDPDETPIEVTLEALDGLVKPGKIRAVGLSNETPWGATRFLALAEARGLPRMASIQNAYSLGNRCFEQGLSEVAYRENCGLLAYSPLGGGALTGKYLGGARPAGARMTLFTRFARYGNPRAEEATRRYVALARENGLDPAQMALAFVHAQPFVTSTIIGVTSLEQLETDLDAFDLTLSPEVLAGIQAIHQEIPNPAP
jgi:aryl-alcohol dehydrogenase-like predicted oxidoreductase